MPCYNTTNENKEEDSPDSADGGQTPDSRGEPPDEKRLLLPILLRVCVCVCINE